MIKSELRKIYLARQKSIAVDARSEKSRQIADLFFQNFDLDSVKILHSFVAIEKFNEIDTSPIFQQIWKEFPQIQTVVPRIDFESGEMEQVVFTAETVLVQNVWSIHEPEHDATVETDAIDMVLAPLVCFDDRGYRVGYGKGFYDRFLGKCRPDCIKIGLSSFPPVAEISDAGSHDVRLDFCITPDEIFTAKAQRDRE